MVQGETVAVFPPHANEGRDQKQQRALGLVEVGYQARDYPHFIRRRYHQGGACLETGEAVLFQIIQNVLQGFGRRQRRVILIGEPLLDMERTQGHALFLQHHTNPIKALQGACAGSTHRDDGLPNLLYQLYTSLFY